MSIRKLPWLKIVGWALLIHIILIAISFLEVFIYSLFKPGQEESFYQEHAQLTAPYVSLIFGFFLFFFVLRMFARKRFDQRIAIALGLPIVYTITDFIIVQWAGVNWSEHLLIFMVSAFFKLLGALLGAWSVKRTNP